MAAPAERMEVRSYNVKYNKLLSAIFVNYTHVFNIPGKMLLTVTVLTFGLLSLHTHQIVMHPF